MSERSFTESVVEDAALAWLESLGYAVKHGPEIASGELFAERGDYGQVILATRLREALVRLNPTLPAEAIKNFLFDQYLRSHRQAEELIKRGESKTLEFKSTLRWNVREDRKDDQAVTHAVLKTIVAFLNTEGGDLLIGVGDDKSIVGIEPDRFENEDKFMLHLSQVVRNGLGDRASTCIDPKTQIVQGKTVCVITCQRSPEPVFLKWKGMEAVLDGDFFVRSGPGTVKLTPDSAQQYIQTRFPTAEKNSAIRSG